MNIIGLRKVTRLTRRMLGADLPAVRPVFFHIPKTAGSSVRRALAEQFCGLPHVAVNTAADFRAVLAMPDWRFNKAAYYAGHFGMETVRRVANRKFVFTFVRDPAERVVSTYWYCRWVVADDPEVHLAKKLSLLEFLTCGDPAVLSAIEDKQARHIIEPGSSRGIGYVTAPPGAETRASDAIAVLETFDFVGLTERYLEGLRHISKGVGFDMPARHENVTAARPSVQNLTIAERDAIEAVIQADRIVYDWAKTRI